MLDRLALGGDKVILTRARGTPRIANRLLRRVRDFAAVSASGRGAGGAAIRVVETLNAHRRRSWI